MKIYTKQEVIKIINLKQNLSELLQLLSQAFKNFSKGHTQMPRPMLLFFPGGDCHIKAGFVDESPYFIVKVATGFPSNSARGLRTQDGTILVYSKEHGLLQAILCDEGYVTTLRTSLAAALAANITPWPIKQIGIIGTGQLACQTISIMKMLYPAASLSIWGRSQEKAQEITSTHEDINISGSIDDMMHISDIVITTTASTMPIIKKVNPKRNMHIIALGADDMHKQECAPELFGLAQSIIVDSKEQALELGDVSHALKSHVITPQQLIELGQVDRALLAPWGFIITDLTGMAVQDVAMVEFIMGKTGY